MTKKEEKFHRDMIFLKRAYGYAFIQLEGALCKVRQGNHNKETTKFLNGGVYLDSATEIIEFMRQTERRTVKVYRTFHNLDGGVKA